MRSTISIVRPHDDALASRPPVIWAIGQLQTALEANGTQASITDRLDLDEPIGLTVLVAGSTWPRARQLMSRAGVSMPDAPEALALVPGAFGDRPLVLACGADERGLVYAVLELADRVVHASDAVGALMSGTPIVQRPANEVRSVARLFSSEDYDTTWFRDEGFWRRYLSMLVAQRFNRFSLTLGLGYNFPRNVTDAYFYFSYPFLVDVPGYQVRVPQLPGEARDRNLALLQWVSGEAVARGLEFQLGLWTHAYAWIDSPTARHTIEGLTPARHAAYCRDALQLLLESCPAISGVTLRIHGESGIPEPSWDFWGEVFSGVVRSGRQVRLDLHAKGLDEKTLEKALATGLPVTVSPKYSAEHQGLPYHQAAIRELDRLPASSDHAASEWHRFMAVSVGSRPFTRYGYGDFLREDRPYYVVFRIWPGTQRVLVWGDPVMASGFGRHAGLAGAKGLEWCEPLSFRGREGTATGGPRDGYADASLSTADDWQKHEYAYRLMGRLTYDPDDDPDVWRRYLAAHYGDAASDVETALGHASRILPLVTTAHHPSASNNFSWPEMAANMPIVREGPPGDHPYLDSPIPRRFGTVSPLDPEIFSSVEGFVDEVLDGERSGRYSPLDVANWLERLSGTAAEHLPRFEAKVADQAPEVRRLIVDIAILLALGRFYAGKMRSAVLHEIAVRTGSRLCARDALGTYGRARTAWADAARRASGVYVDDFTFGPQPHLRGSWSDRLPAIDRDIAEMGALRLGVPSTNALSDDEVGRLLSDADREPPAMAVTHLSPESFRRGASIDLRLDVAPASAELINSVSLRYRRLNQAEPYAQTHLAREAHAFVGSIPVGYADSGYPVQYFFVLHDVRGGASLFPGLDADLSNQPYYVLREAQ